MDPSYMSSGDDEEAIAKQMGFSSFGTQSSAKKRKYNPHADAMVKEQELVSRDRGGKKGQGSGGNKVPLGKPRVIGVASSQNQEEIKLDAESSEGDDRAHIDTGLPPPSKEEDSEEDEGPAYIDTSSPPPNEDARVAQQKIDAILTNHANSPLLLDSSKIILEASGIGQKVGELTTAQHGGPRASDVITSGLVRARYQPRPRGQRNEFWYIDYYDPSFNENPWAKLEKANGLQSSGVWLERGGQAL